MKFLILLILLTAVASANEPFRIVVVADQDGTSRANEFRDYLRQQVPPFNRMRDEDLQITVRTLSASENQMNCHSDPDPQLQRLVTCDTAFLQNIGGNALTVGITSIPNVNGGSGGPVPVGTTQLPFPMIVHEMLHTAGITDEYKHESATELAYYCNPPVPSANFAYFKANPPYASEGEARTRHAPDVRWMARILPETPVRPSPETLGTPEPSIPVAGSQKIGLYPGDTCPPDASGKRSWRPYPVSLMRDQVADGTVYPIYEQALVQYIRDRIGRDVPLRTRRAEDRSRLAALEVEIPVQYSVDVPESGDASTVSEQ